MHMIIRADARRIPLADKSVQCCVTSPPYWGLRDYGVSGQIGLERTPDEYVTSILAVFREVRRVLKDDGTLWLNLGDTYANVGKWGRHSGWRHTASENGDDTCRRRRGVGSKHRVETEMDGPNRGDLPGLKPKDIVGIPWRVAFALQADGWYLRSDIIWSKPNPMPESVTDRPTKAHEYIFLLSKSERYFYDAKAIGEPVTASTVERLSQATLDQQQGSARVPGKTNGNMKAVAPRFGGSKYGENDAEEYRTKSGNEYTLKDGIRNARTVWQIATQPYSEAHFATFPEELPRRCILAGCPEGGTVLDPFNGSGTTGAVAVKHGRHYVGLELSPEYIAMARDRIGKAEKPNTHRSERVKADAPLFGVSA